MSCKRAHLAAYNGLLATLKMDMNPQSGDLLKQLEDAKETCLVAKNPDESCHEKMQTTLQHTQQVYDQILDDYKNRYVMLQNRPSPTLRM